MLEKVEKIVKQLGSRGLIHHHEILEMFSLYNEIFQAHETNHTCSQCVSRVKKEIFKWYEEETQKRNGQTDSN